MKNAGLTIGMLAIGLGLASIGFNLNGNQANATPAAFAPAGSGVPDVPHVVEYLTYSTMGNSVEPATVHHYRFWSHGIVDYTMGDCAGGTGQCVQGWTLIDYLSEGYVANTDLNGDRVIDGEDLGIILANYGSTSATLLANPDVGDAEVVGASRPGFPAIGWTGTGGIPVTRLWSSGLLEQGHLPFYHRTCEGYRDSPPAYGWGKGQVCGFGWVPISSSLPAQMRLGDINRDNEVSGGDLGLLLGDFGS